MQQLDAKYKERLQSIAEVIQGSEELANYLENEQIEQYKILQETYEPMLAAIYEEVGETNPLQLFELEKVLLNPAFEGLFLPRILGYSVLRGEITDQYKYAKPQEHFKTILMTIANSANFEVIKQRIGQTLQLGFALSSDIWITHLLELVENKKVKSFFQSMIHARFRNLEDRRDLYLRYQKQFAHFNFHYSVIPQNLGTLKAEAASMQKFLMSRIAFKLKHDSYLDEIHQFVGRKEFYKEPEFIEILMLIAHFIPLNSNQTQQLANAVNSCRFENQNFNSLYFNFLKNKLKSGFDFPAEADQKFLGLLNKNPHDDLLKYYLLMDTLHQKGFVHEDSLDAVNAMYSQYEGMSLINECLRLSMLQKFRNVVEHLAETEYHVFMELFQTFTAYINIFGNAAFKHEVESLCMAYVRKLLAHYKDKRSKEYQEIKKFVSDKFIEIEFLTEKEVVDLFKIKRKKKE